MSSFQIKKLVPEATIPTSGSPGAAGYDLHSCVRETILPGKWGMIRTGLAISIPDNTYARIAPRSGLAAKKGINVHAGVVDWDYRGEVCVILMNHNTEPFEIEPGDRIAQLILTPYVKPDITEVTELSDTQRGADGFGSTGK